MAMQLGPSHDAQRFRTHNRLALAVAFVGVLLLLTRLVLVQWVRGEKYEKYAAIERVAKVRAQAPRGLVKGADGTVLARNIESHRLEILTNRVKPERVVELAQTLRGLLDMTDAEFEKVVADLNRPVDPRKRRPLVVRRDLVSTHCPYDSSKLELVAEIRYGFCTLCGRLYEPVPGRRACPFDQKRLVPSGDGKAVHCPSCEREFHDGKTCAYDHHSLRPGQHVLICPLCQRSFNDEVAVLRANLHRLPEARVVAEIQREYPYRYLASHVLGYMGYVSRKEIDAQEASGAQPYGLNDRIGRTGLERALQDLLRGTDGEQVLVKRRGGEEQAQDLDELIAALQPEPTVPGASVRLTLDLELQRAVKVAMKDVYSGAAVVLDTRSGGVLALYSKPSFDPNTMSGKRTPHARAIEDIAAYAPLLNKALHPFPPASVYKVVAAAAALEEGLVTPRTTVTCKGHYEFGGRRFHCHQRRGHGELDLQQAIRSSCDIYFYQLGERLGLDLLERYARKMGFGEATGIEIHERTGRIPTRAWYKDHVKGGYYPGFALSTAVGQKDVTATPLQVARVYAGLARGGSLQPVHLVEAFEQPDGPLRAPQRKSQTRDMGLKPSTVELLRHALYDVVNSEGGTASGARPATTVLSGKTGTAQAAQRARPEMLDRLRDDPQAAHRLVQWLQNDHAWFAGYAPASAPEITVVVFIEHGGSGGHNAAPIVRQIVDAWFSQHPLPVSLQPAPQPSRKATPTPARAEPAAPVEDEVPVPDPEALPSDHDEPEAAAEPEDPVGGAP